MKRELDGPESIRCVLRTFHDDDDDGRSIKAQLPFCAKIAATSTAVPAKTSLLIIRTLFKIFKEVVYPALENKRTLT